MSETLAELAGEPVAATGIDGCGAPVMAISLTGLARAFGRLASAPAGHRRGPGRLGDHAPIPSGSAARAATSPRLIRGLPGAVAKDGAESVYALGLPDGRGVALKIADGAQRARPVVMAAALARLGVEADVLAELAHAPVLGHGEPVGAVVAVGL